MKNKMQDVVIITTGGTIEKVYDEGTGALENRGSTVEKMLLSYLRLPYTRLHSYSIMSKDSALMTDDDRELLLQAVKGHLNQQFPILILHGTDSLAISAEYIQKNLNTLLVPVIFTGAMKPLGFLDSDATQNVTEALLACKIIGPGVYVCFHNHLFKVPHVKKNVERGTFEPI